MIGPIDKQAIRVERARETGKVDPGQERKPAPQQRGGDRVEISAEARQRAAELETVTGLSPERVAEIRGRLADGTYGTGEVLEAVARTMIERGEI